MDGVEIAGCRVVERLSAEVFRAIDLATGEPAVLRYLAGRSTRSQRIALDRACSLEHSALARSRCVQVDGGSLLHISDWLGERLDRVGRSRGSRGGPIAVRRTLELAEALDWTHRRGVVHGRLRSGCVFMGADERVRIAELGSAAVASRVPVRRWAVAAPEALVASAAPLDPRLDVYGLGVVLFELLSGQSPFERESSELTLAAVLAGDIPRCAWQRLPRPMREVCRRAIAVDPEHRWGSMAELREAVGSAAARLGWTDLEGGATSCPTGGNFTPTKRWFQALRRA